MSKVRGGGADRARVVRSLVIILSILSILGLPVPGKVHASWGITGGPLKAAPMAAAPVPVGSRLGAAQQAVSPTPSPTWDPNDLPLLVQYLDAAWNAQDWVRVLQLIEAIKAIDPSYDDIDGKLYFAHINYGYELLTEGKCTESLAEFRKALQLQPEGEEALMGLDLVGRYCATQTPAVTATPATTIVATSTPQMTIVPGTTATPTPQVLSKPITYTVQPGDTLYSLAKRYSTTVQTIMQANGMMSYFLRAGELIWLPASGDPPPGPQVHIVQPGETLYSIAQLYNTTVWAIMAANGLSSSTIWAYQALYVPSVTQPGPVIHIVQAGETLFTIAMSYGTTVALIMAANGLRTYDIYVYQQLIIPPVGWAGWPALTPGSPTGSPYVHQYVVQPGDTLYSIARRFGVTVAALKAANGLRGSFILAGSTLRIP